MLDGHPAPRFQAVRLNPAGLPTLPWAHLPRHSVSLDSDWLYLPVSHLAGISTVGFAANPPLATPGSPVRERPPKEMPAAPSSRAAMATPWQTMAELKPVAPRAAHGPRPLFFPTAPLGMQGRSSRQFLHVLAKISCAIRGRHKRTFGPFLTQ
jgi:hypothetical protein